MKKILFFVLVAAFLLGGGVAGFAADVTLSWDQVAGADGYKLYMSTDGRQTWGPQFGVDVGDVTQYTWVGVPEDGIDYFRASSYQMTETARLNAGAWFDGTQPVSGAPGVGVQ